MTAAARTLWLKIQEPRVVTVVQLGIYLTALGGGIVALTDPPMTIEGEVGTTMMTVLGALLAFGGLLGACTVLQGVWWLERPAVLAVGTAALVYGAIVLGLHFAAPGTRLLQLAFITIVLLTQIQRWVRIRDLPNDPERDADIPPPPRAH